MSSNSGPTAKTTSEDGNWWDTEIIYQIYPRSFQDGDGDGVGDLKGLIRRLDYFDYLGIKVLWLSPIYCSPMADFGYDISNFFDVDPLFGTMEQFEELTKKMRHKGMKLIMDIVPNHTSIDHPWFVESSKSKTGPFADFYIWNDGRLVDGKRCPPNNWVSVFGGSVWTWHPLRQQFYLHQFAKEQPDLNWANKKAREEIWNVFEFWFNRGVDGFRVDAVAHLCEDEQLRDEEPRKDGKFKEDEHNYLVHNYTMLHPDTYHACKELLEHVEEYEHRHKLCGADRKLLIWEIYTDDAVHTTADVMKFYLGTNSAPFNFSLLFPDVDKELAVQLCYKIKRWMNALPKGKSTFWVIGNHDQARVDFDEYTNIIYIVASSF